MAGRDDVEAIDAFVGDFSVGGFEHAIDEEGVIWTQYGIVSQPAFVFINDDGTVETNIGPMGEDGIVDAVEKLIAG